MPPFWLHATLYKSFSVASYDGKEHVKRCFLSVYIKEQHNHLSSRRPWLLLRLLLLCKQLYRSQILYHCIISFHYLQSTVVLLCKKINICCSTPNITEPLDKFINQNMIKGKKDLSVDTWCWSTDVFEKIIRCLWCSHITLNTPVPLCTAKLNGVMPHLRL